ncbi:hypothetical protein F443_15431 [Phytophthora nicotianae P1569]|uniref:Uncharacterized protein n=1 Tax=Phytophthora nicotianae P1569 TaxID=1317065 RepID=V9ELK3_PHYNI|nr:hypothetical protein F443_15431 [Phytophthora nicotianae P1569]
MFTSSSCLHTSHFLQPFDVAVFGPFKRYFEKGSKTFPVLNNNRFPIKDDIADIACDPLIRACCPDNANAAFEEEGIVPLSLDGMMKGIIGNKPVVTCAGRTKR